MMSRIRLVTTGFAVALLAACGGFTSSGHVDRLAQATPVGSAFTQALTGEYRALARYEQFEMYDYRDAQRYAKKGLRAAEGEVVAPYTTGDFNLPMEHVSGIQSQRDRLLSALDANGRRSHPALAATAQAKFDCWLEQREENHQPDHIARCRQEFMDAMAALEQAMAPEPQPAPQPAPEVKAPMKTVFTVYFPFDSAQLTDRGVLTVNKVADHWHNRSFEKIHITGHTDSSGAAAYNRNLSRDRGVAVHNALQNRGVPSDAIHVKAMGESQMAVETGDGVREPRNRRAVIRME